MSQRNNSQGLVENKGQLQEEQNILNKLSDIWNWLQNKLYIYISPIVRYLSPIIDYVSKIVLLCFLVIVFILGVIYVIILFILGFIYAMWNFVLKKLIYLLICEIIFMRSISTLDDFCVSLSASDKGNSTATVLPIDSVIEKTVSIAERLSETDVTVPVMIAEIEIALLDLKTSVLYSEIEQAIQSQLLEQIDDIRNSASTTADEIRRMIAAFNSVLAKIEVYIKELHRFLNKENSDKIGSRFEQFLERIESEIGRIIHLANYVHSQLVNLERKPEVLVEIAASSHQIEQKKFEQIENAAIMSKIYHATIGNGNIEKIKHKRNLEVLNQFPVFTQKASNKIKTVIGQLADFRHEIKEVKYTVSKMERAQTLEVDVHIEILNKALESLGKYREQFDRRITDNNKNQKQISN